MPLSWSTPSRASRTDRQGWTSAGLRNRLPDHVQLVILENQARFIEASITNLRSTAFLGAFLAVAVLFAFLKDFRATAIIAAAIPLSIVATFAPMYMGGVSLNLMSLGGLALGIGMLVDNAVVVLENIQVFVERGLSRRDAAVRGANEVSCRGHCVHPHHRERVPAHHLRRGRGGSDLRRPCTRGRVQPARIALLVAAVRADARRPPTFAFPLPTAGRAFAR